MGATVSHPRTGRIYVALHGGGVTAEGQGQGQEQGQGQGQGQRQRQGERENGDASPARRSRGTGTSRSAGIHRASVSVTRAAERKRGHARGVCATQKIDVGKRPNVPQLHSHAASPACRIGNRCERARGGGREGARTNGSNRGGDGSGPYGGERATTGHEPRVPF